MKNAPLLFFLIGIVLVWCGFTGRLGVVLAAIFEPERVNVDG